MKRRKYLPLVPLFMAATLVASGCGSSSSSAPTSAAPQSSTSSAAPQKPVEISLWYGVGGASENTIKELSDKFNASHPSIKVVPFYAGSYSAGGPLQQKLLAAIAANQVPDVVQLELHALCTFASKDALLTLDDLMAKSDHDKKDDFLPGLLTNTTCDGKTYGIPFNRSVPILYYNADMFKKAGIAKPPSTWDELAADAAKLTSDGPNGKVYGFEPVNQWWFFEAMTWTAGGDTLSQDQKTAAFASEQGAKGLKVWQDLINKGYATVHTGPNDFLDTIGDFKNQKTAMYFGSSADMGNYAQATFDWRATQPPTFEAGAKLIVPEGGADGVIMAKAPADHRAAAWEFLQWWTAAEQTSYWSQKTGYVPVAKSVLENPAFKDYLQKEPNHAVPLDELKFARSAPSVNSYFQVLQIIQEAQQNIISNKAPLMETLQAAQKKANEVLKDQ